MSECAKDFADAQLDMYRTLTFTESLGLDAEFNVADGHARQMPNYRQQLVLDNAGHLFRRALSKRQSEIEAEFLEVFFQHQHASYSLFAPAKLLYSASLGIDVAARLLRSTDSTVGLITPTFDNLHCLLAAQGLTINPIHESDLQLGNLEEPMSKCDCLFLVLPNNPTGFTLNTPQLAIIATACAERGKLLIIDASFRYFDVNAPDLYNILHSTSCNFMVIEDTGKFLSVADQKLGIIVADSTTKDQVCRICEDILLNVSPFTVALLTEFLKADDRDATLNLVRKNRLHLQQACGQLGWTEISQLEHISVSLVQPTFEPEFLEEARRAWESNGLVVLPGAPFFWHDSRGGARLLRFALMRDTPYFQGAVDRLVSLEHTQRLLESKAARASGS